ncbi:MAG: hypothetical protein HY835_01810, partial [Anaerolineae bacterium]|nr:hypothetical protein [Anaerolineae bacterium]
FFNVSLNERWVGNMKELAAQNSGDVDFPPQLQWARRPVWFGIQNMIQWGFGLPLGLLAWAGFLVMGWRILRGDWAKHTLLWGWTALYVLWQSSSATPSMRYFMPVYPILVILAAWVLFHLWNQPHSRKLFQSLAVGMGVVATLGTLLYAYAFLQIYIKPFTRVEASRWIYDTIPAPVNVPIDTGSSVKAMRLPFSLGYRMTAGRPIRFAFTPQAQRDLIGVDFPYIKDNRSDPPVTNLLLTVLDKPSDEGGLPLAYGALSEVFLAEGDVRGRSYQAVLDRPVQALPGTTYYLEITSGDDQAQFELYDTPVLVFQNAQGGFSQPLPEFVTGLRQGETFNTSFSPVVSGKISQIDLTHVVDWEARTGEKILSASLMNADTGETLATGVINSAFLPTGDVRGESYTIQLDQAVQVMTTNRYNLTLVFQSGPGVLAVYGSKHALETSWDDALPLGIDGYSPYDIFNGIYRTDLNFEMYWDDNAEKRIRFERALDQADLIYMSSNRQWGTTVRVPERYPLTTLFYRELIGCPADKEVFWCYAVAQPGMFQGRLGYELVKVVQSEPQLGSLMFNSQFGEEAFSVYDHPKVMVFQKTDSYSAASVRDVLRSVDLTKVVHLTPAQADKYPGNLLLPANRLDGQRKGGTWSELFDREALQNKYPGLAVVLWYVVLTLLGWVVYPTVRMALRGLPDRGYPLARTAGMVLLAYPTWLAGSAGIPFTKTTITLVALGLVAINLILGWIQRRELLAELRANWRSMVLVEVVGLLFFGLFLLVRIGNPDLWHPWKGGEKPMDFSYFNAVLKSNTFPPFDPWFAGGYINYYYYGFVLVGVPVKWLGIVPATAYNIILPQLFSLLALGGFSAVWNLLSARQNGHEARAERTFPFWPALGGAVMLNILGNLGTIRMIWHGLMRLVVPG